MTARLSADSQTAASVLMIRPARFCANDETAASNVFQRAAADDPKAVHKAALLEWHRTVDRLRDAGVEVVVLADTLEPPKPDALFPNNWVSFHADGTVVLYPMEAMNRRSERRLDIIEALSIEHGFFVREILDLSGFEGRGVFLEGTGSLVLDRLNHVGYACLSSRTHGEALGEFAQLLDYEIVAFDAADADGRPIYHTNFMMSIGTQFCVICDEAIRDDRQRDAVIGRLKESGRSVMSISESQMASSAGNILELQSQTQEPLILMSERARAAFSSEQLVTLESFGQLITVALDTIEDYGGGSVRCMIAEIFLPRSGEA